MRALLFILALAACGVDPVSETKPVSKPSKHAVVDAGTPLPSFYTAGAVGGAVQTSFSASQTLEIYFYVATAGTLHLEIFDPSSNAYGVINATAPSWQQLPVAGTFISQYSLTGEWMANAFVNGVLVGTVTFEVTP